MPRVVVYLCGLLGTCIRWLRTYVWWLGPVSVGWVPLWVAVSAGWGPLGVVGYLYKLVGDLCWVVCISMGLLQTCISWLGTYVWWLSTCIGWLEALVGCF